MNKFYIEYRCKTCAKKAPKGYDHMICPYCNGELRGSSPGVIGTRDGFGISREFYDTKTATYIDNFKKWEKAGFKEPGDLGCKNSRYIKDKVKELKKTKNYQKRSKVIDVAERM